MGFTTKERVSSNLSTSSINGKRTNTLVLRYSTRSFGNKLLVTLDWPSKSRKHHRRLSKCDQGKRIKGKIFFVGKNIIFEIVPATFSISINILFTLFSLFCFANFCRIKFYEICAYISKLNEIYIFIILPL